MKWPGDGTLIATCGGGAELALEAEIRALGMEPVSRGNGTVRFRGGAREMIAANLRLRTASRVVVPVGGGRVTSYDSLYGLARRTPWHRLVPSRRTIAVTAVVRDRSIGDSRLAALKVKDAVVDTQRKLGSRSSIDRRNPDYPVVLHVADGTATISLDSSGSPLHERGYRTEAVEAPLRETVAAAMLMVAGWDASRPLLDPFCGSGTVAIEAAMIAAGTAPGLIERRYAFERWDWIDARSVERERASLPRARVEPRVAITARDVDPEAIGIATRNAERAGVARWIAFERMDVATGPAPGGPGTIVTNPPYGERMQLEHAQEFYRDLGDRLKREYAGWDAWILSANRDAMKAIGLRAASRTRLWNGGLDARLYEIRSYGREA